jgi:hypothetical protein
MESPQYYSHPSINQRVAQKRKGHKSKRNLVTKKSSTSIVKVKKFIQNKYGGIKVQGATQELHESSNILCFELYTLSLKLKC